MLGYSVPIAHGRWARLLGLALLSRERAGAGLLIPRCSSVHTIGMRFRLDVVFLDREGRPLRTVAAVRPFRVIGCRGAAAALEMPAPGSRLSRRVSGSLGKDERSTMSLIDKLTGRFKKAAGDITDDPQLRREGANEERKGEAKEELSRTQDAAAEKAREVGDLERKT